MHIIANVYKVDKFEILIELNHFKLRVFFAQIYCDNVIIAIFTEHFNLVCYIDVNDELLCGQKEPLFKQYHVYLDLLLKEFIADALLLF